MNYYHILVTNIVVGNFKKICYGCEDFYLQATEVFSQKIHDSTTWCLKKDGKKYIK